MTLHVSKSFSTRRFFSAPERWGHSVEKCDGWDEAVKPVSSWPITHWIKTYVFDDISEENGDHGWCPQFRSLLVSALWQRTRWETRNGKIHLPTRINKVVAETHHNKHKQNIKNYSPLKSVKAGIVWVNWDSVSLFALIKLRKDVFERFGTNKTGNANVGGNDDYASDDYPVISELTTWR